MAKKNLLDPKVRAAKKRKQAIILGVVFVAVLAFQGPRTLKMMNPPAPETTASSQSASETATETAPSDGATAGSTAATTGTALAVASTAADVQVLNADLAPAPLAGQLTEFTVFDAKDPFVQHPVAKVTYKSSETSSSPAPVAATSSTSTSTAAHGVGQTSDEPTAPTTAAPGGEPVTQPTTAPATPTQPATPAAAKPSGATISVNGVSESVSLGADFPAAIPTFRLVKLTASGAQISIAGGTLASGAPTVKLVLGKALTLMNTADGTRYVLILVSTGPAPAGASSTPTP
jgi:hypothetical protein